MSNKEAEQKLSGKQENKKNSQYPKYIQPQNSNHRGNGQGPAFNTSDMEFWLHRRYLSIIGAKDNNPNIVYSHKMCGKLVKKNPVPFSKVLEEATNVSAAERLSE